MAQSWCLQDQGQGKARAISLAEAATHSETSVVDGPQPQSRTLASGLPLLGSISSFQCLLGAENLNMLACVTTLL